MGIAITRERADSPDAIALLSARDAELEALYPPEARFKIPISQHARDDVMFLIAREDGAARGCGALQLHSGYVELKSMFVMPEARGRRLAVRLVEALEELARTLGYTEVKLETGIYSHAAIRAYERCGYEQCERFGSYPNAPLSVFMQKRIQNCPMGRRFSERNQNG